MFGLHYAAMLKVAWAGREILRNRAVGPWNLRSSVRIALLRKCTNSRVLRGRRNTKHRCTRWVSCCSYDGTFKASNRDAARSMRCEVASFDKPTDEDITVSSSARPGQLPLGPQASHHAALPCSPLPHFGLHRIRPP